MGLITLLSDLRAARVVDELTQQIARRGYLPLRKATEQSVVGMTQSQARGYVWAKSRPIIERNVELVAAAQPRFSAWAQRLLAERSQERLVRIVAGDLERDRARYVDRRRAA